MSDDSNTIKADLLKAFETGKLKEFSTITDDGYSLSGKKVVTLVEGQMSYQMSVSCKHDEYSYDINMINNNIRFHPRTRSCYRRKKYETNLKELIKAVRIAERSFVKKLSAQARRSNIIISEIPALRKTWPPAVETPEALKLKLRWNDSDKRIVWMGKYLYIDTAHSVSKKYGNHTEYIINTWHMIENIDFREILHTTEKRNPMTKAIFKEITDKTINLDNNYPAYAAAESIEYKTHMDGLEALARKNEGLVADAMGHEFEAHSKDSPNVIIAGSLEAGLKVSFSEEAVKNNAVDIQFARSIQVPLGLLPDLVGFLKKAAVYHAIMKVE